MSKLRALGLSCMLTLAAYSAPASAQYMYLDVDGDSLNTSADRLNADGPTVLTIYLNTNHDRDGTLQTCNSHAASCGASTTGQPLDMFSYTVSLIAVGGTVQWGPFTPADDAYTPLGENVSDSVSVEINRSRPVSTFTAPGLSVLGSITVTIISGLPQIEVAHGATTADPFGFGTGFGTECSGHNYPNTYVLGDWADLCGSGGDWSDADGVAEPELPPSISAPSAISQTGGAAVSVSATAVDPNLDDTVTFSASGYPQGLSLSVTDSSSNTAEAVLSGTLAGSDEGTYTIVWQASDGFNAPVTSTTTMYVSPQTNIGGPIVSAPDSIRSAAGAPITVHVTATDPLDTDPITWLIADLIGLPPGNNATFTVSTDHSQGTLTWTPTLNDVSTYSVAFTAEVRGVAGSATTRITVTSPDRPPALTAPTSVTAIEGAEVSVTVSASDPDGDGIATLTASPLPLGAAFTPTADFSSGVISWMPNFTQAGTYTISFTASNLLTASTNTIIVVGEGDPQAIRSVVLHLPAPGYRVEVQYAQTLCNTAGNCRYDVLYADNDSSVYVPLVWCPAGPQGQCYFGDRVHIEFPAWTPTGFFDARLAPPKDIYPETETDRPYDFTPSADGYMAETLAFMKQVHDFCDSTFHLSRDALRVQLTDIADDRPVFYSDVDDRINWPRNSNYWENRPYPQFLKASSIAHEYTHALQHQVFRWDFCSETNQPYECYHDLCVEEPQETAWGEGFAQAAAEAFNWRVQGRFEKYFFYPIYLPCSAPGLSYEDNVISYLVPMILRNGTAVMNTWRVGRIGGDGVYPVPRPAITLDEFHGLWENQDLWSGSDGRYIATQAPGPFDAKAYYQFSILHTLSGVTDAPSPPGRAGWIERAYPNPVSAVLRLEIKSMGVPSVIEVFGVDGRLTLRTEYPILPFGTNVVDLDVRKLASGIYFLRYRDAQGSLSTARRRIAILR